MHGDKTPMFVGLLVSGLIYATLLTLVLPADTPPETESTWESPVAEDPPLREKSSRDDLPPMEIESSAVVEDPS